MTAGQEAHSSPDPHPAAAPARGATLLLTHLTKVAGLIVAVHEAFTTKDPVVLAVAALMIAGGQFSETMVLGLIDRFLGRDR
jgi:hypothetical protein